jgi:hypothetical protein
VRAHIANLIPKPRRSDLATDVTVRQQHSHSLCQSLFIPTPSCRRVFYGAGSRALRVVADRPRGAVGERGGRRRPGGSLGCRDPSVRGSGSLDHLKRGKYYGPHFSLEYFLQTKKG